MSPSRTSNSHRIDLLYKLNMAGEITHPCLTPVSRFLYFLNSFSIDMQVITPSICFTLFKSLSHVFRGYLAILKVLSVVIYIILFYYKLLMTLSITQWHHCTFFPSRSVYIIFPILQIDLNCYNDNNHVALHRTNSVCGFKSLYTYGKFLILEKVFFSLMRIKLDSFYSCRHCNIWCCLITLCWIGR